MQINQVIFKELLKRGYSLEKNRRIWDISNSKLWYLTPELAKGFLNLRNYNPYRRRVIDDEIELIRKHTGRIHEAIGKNKFNLIDLGCGNGIKAEVFIKSLPKNVKLRYCPIDISPYYLKETVRRIKSLSSDKIASVKPMTNDFMQEPYIIGMLRNGEYQTNLSILLGETISHYDVHDLLFKLSNNMFPGDIFVIGNGIRIGKRFVNLNKYRSPLFNDWFIHIMRGLGFKDNEARVDVRFAHGRLEGFYHVLVDKTISRQGRSVHFKKGDEIIVAAQHKFFENELKKFCSMYFSKVELLKTSDKEYCLVVCRK